MDGQVPCVRDRQPGMLKALSVEQTRTLTKCIFSGRGFPKESMTFKKKKKLSTTALKEEYKMEAIGVGKTRRQGAAKRGRGKGRQEVMLSL